MGMDSCEPEQVCIRASIIVSDAAPKGVTIQCLSALCEQSVPAEVLLPDLGNFLPGSETTLRDMRLRYPHLCVLPRRPGLNRAQQLNEAVEQAKGDLLLFTESHCIVGRDWVKLFVEHFENSATDAATGPLVSADSGSYTSRCEKELREVTLQNIEKLGLTGAFLDFHSTAVRRDTLRRLGGLSPELPMMCEFELGARLDDASVRIERIAVLPVIHHDDSTIDAYSSGILAQGRDRVRLHLMGNADFARHYFPLGFDVKFLMSHRIFRYPVFLVMSAWLGFLKAGFRVSEKVHLFPIARILFWKVAFCSHFHGQVIALLEAAP